MRPDIRYWYKHIPTWCGGLFAAALWTFNHLPQAIQSAFTPLELQAAGSALIGLGIIAYYTQKHEASHGNPDHD